MSLGVQTTLPWGGAPPTAERRVSVPEENSAAAGAMELLWSVEALTGLAEHQDRFVAHWAADRLELLDSAGGDPEEECLPSPAEAEALRRRAIEGLGGPDDAEIAEILWRLRDCPWRWASDLLQGHLPALMKTHPDEVWDLVSELGDPRMLDRVVDAWTPGEAEIAETAVFLASLGGRSEDLAAPLREDAERAAAQREELLERGLDHMMAALSDEPLRLPLRCTDCGHTSTHDIDRVYVSGEVIAASKNGGEDPSWDGFLLARVVVCEGCDAEDRYALTPEAHLRLMGVTLRATFDVGPGDDRVVMGQVMLHDGTEVNRPTQAIEHLRAQAEARPDDGAGWRRLGNIQARFDLRAGAVQAWRRAAADPREAEGAYSLSAALEDAGDPEAVRWACTALERLPDATLTVELRREIAFRLCDQLRVVVPYLHPPVALMAVWPGASHGGRQTVHASGADLRYIHDWAFLAELIGDGTFLSLSFTESDGDYEDSQLLQLLRGGVRPPRAPLVRPGAKVGRNAPCPCGSGRKHKRCCLKSRS